MGTKKLTINGKDEKAFLKCYNHKDIKSVKSIGLKWSDLVDLHDHYCKYVKNDLELKAPQLHSEMVQIKGAYIVRYRVKDPEHLVNKIIRKKIEKGRVITKDNYLEEIDDFIGIRILHLFKNDWEEICKDLMSKYELKEKPVAYYRDGDDNAYLGKCKAIGVDPKMHSAGYRSIHFIVNVPFFGTVFKCEVQVRTIFEEAWSEIDHLVRYPDNTDNVLLNNYLMMFNALAAHADSMGTYLMELKTNMLQELKMREDLLKEIDMLKDDNQEKNAKIDELKRKLEQNTKMGWPFMPKEPMQSTLDYVTSIQTPSGSTAVVYPYASMKESIEDRIKRIEKENIIQSIEKGEVVFKMPKIGGTMPPDSLNVPPQNNDK